MNGNLSPVDRASMLVIALRVLAFDPGQARDERGQWTSEGGSGSSSGKSSGKGSGDVRSQKADWYRDGGEWNRSLEGEQPYGWRSDDPNYVVPEITHMMVRTGGEWGGSHGTSQEITGAASQQMGIPGYRTEDVSDRAEKIAGRFLTEIAKDTGGSEEVLHHSFENIRGTEFKTGDTMRLPLTATSGDVNHYGVRLDYDDQEGQPVVFRFEKGTQMVAFSGMTKADAKEMGHKTVSEAIKERGHVWDEAIVAGGFRVTDVETKYMGSQQNRDRAYKGIRQVYGKVVSLKQIETFDPVTGWKPR